jgi:hypothetical protein
VSADSGSYVNLSQLYPLAWTDPDDPDLCAECGYPTDYTNAWGTPICPHCWDKRDR